MATTEELTIVARVKDSASAALDKIRGKIKKLRADGVLDFKKLWNAVKELKSGFMLGLGAVTKLAAGFTAAVTGAALLSKSFSEASADAEELSSKFDALFGEGASAARDWAENYRQSVNRGSQATLEALAAMRGFTEGLGLASEEADALAMELTQLGVDLSSFYNVAQDDAMQRLRSGLIGNAEALDAFAARISETQLKEYAEANGILYNSLTDTEKVLLRLEVLYGKVNKAVGDAERTSGSFQNQMRGLAQGLEDVRAELGVRVNTAIQDVIAGLGGPQGVIDLFKVFGATMAEVAIATAEVAGLIGKDLLDSIHSLGGTEVTIDRIRLAFAKLKRDVMAAALSIRSSLSDIAGGYKAVLEGMGAAVDTIDVFGIVDKIQDTFGIGGMEPYEGLFDSLIMNDMQRRAMEWQLSIIDEFLDKSEEAIEQRARQIAQFGAGPLPLPLIPEEPIGPMFGPEMAPAAPIGAAPVAGAEEDSAWQAAIARAREYADAKRQAIEADKAHELALQGQARALWPQISAGIRAATTVASDYFGKLATWNESQETLRQDAEAWRAGNAEIQRRRDLASNLFPTLQMGWRAAADAAQQYAVKVRQTETAEAQMRSTADAIVSAFQLMVTQTENLSDALKNLARSLAADLLGAQLRAAIFPLFGFAKGGVIPGGMGDAMPVKGYATGGPIMRSPHVALIGEGQYNEAVVPLPDGRSIPVTMNGAGGDSGRTEVSFNVTALDAASVADLFARNGKELAEIVASRFQRSRNVQASLGGGLV